MRTYLLILPIALLVAYSQIIVKWRTNSDVFESAKKLGLLEHLLKFLSDPMIMSAYVAALLASFAWLFVVTKLPLNIAFPVYIGVTFGMVILGGWFFLSEVMTIMKSFAILLILCGIVLGMKS